MGYSEIRFRSKDSEGRGGGGARQGEPAMILVRFEFSLVFRLTDLSSYQIEMNQSQGNGSDFSYTCGLFTCKYK